MHPLIQEISDLKKQYEKKIKDSGEKALKEVFKELFNKYPTLYKIAWRQYTPYYMDGDPCHFIVYEMDAYLLDKEELEREIANTKALLEKAQSNNDYKKVTKISQKLDELSQQLSGNIDYDDYGETLYTLKKSKNPIHVEIAKEVGTIKKEIPEDVMEAVFGDHVMVVASREGFSVSEVEHD